MKRHRDVCLLSSDQLEGRRRSSRQASGSRPPLQVRIGRVHPEGHQPLEARPSLRRVRHAGRMRAALEDRQVLHLVPFGGPF